MTTKPAPTCQYCEGSGEPSWTNNRNLIACPACHGKRHVEPVVGAERVDEYNRANAALRRRIERNGL